MPSTGDGVEGGSGVEAEHWVEGEEGSVEGGNDIGVEGRISVCGARENRAASRRHGEIHRD
jgi:hypothetical protein